MKRDDRKNGHSAQPLNIKSAVGSPEVGIYGQSARDTTCPADQAFRCRGPNVVEKIRLVSVQTRPRFQTVDIGLPPNRAPEQVARWLSLHAPTEQDKHPPTVSSEGQDAQAFGRQADRAGN